MTDALEKLKVYNVVLGALSGCAEEACVSCMCTENILVKLNKRLKKLKHDLSEISPGEKERSECSAKVDKLLEIADRLPIKADNPQCLMTRGICKLPKCIAGNISEILNLVDA